MDAGPSENFQIALGYGIAVLFTHYSGAVHIAFSDTVVICDGAMHGATIVPHNQVTLRPAVAVDYFRLGHMIE